MTAMPELPEVQTIADALATLIVGQAITAVSVLWAGVVDRPEPALFVDALCGRRILEVGRRGKYLLFRLDDDRWLVMHLRMTGEMRVVPISHPLDRHDHLVFRLEDGQEWRFRDQRKFGRAYLVDDPAQIVGRLGPEPLSPAFTASHLATVLAGRRAPIKSLLLDQRIVAGIGNIYADESLYRARIHPLSEGGALDEAQREALVGAVRTVIQEALLEMGTTLRDYRRPDGSLGNFQNRLQVFRRTDEPCPSCGAPIRRIVVGGRSTHFCPVEQVRRHEG